MKKFILSIAAVAALAAFTSCGDDAVLTAGLAEEAVKKDLYWESNPKQTAELTTGYFEVSYDDYVKYQQLQAAGVITLTAEKAVEAKQRYSWRGYYYEYIDHYYANVALTEEGQKYLFTDEVKHGRADIAKDLKLDEMLEDEKLPEYLTNYPELKVTTLKPEPKQQTEEADEEPVAEPLYKDDSYFQVDDEPAGTPKEPSAYEKAQAKVNFETVTVVTGELEIVKAKEVFCPEEYWKVGKGECKIIIEFTGKTPFGYALGAPREGSRYDQKIELKRYEDLGWVVED